MPELYPLKFKPLLRETIWGGRKLETVLGQTLPAGKRIGESWLISGVEDMETSLENGFLKGNTLNELAEVYMGDLVGDHVFERFGERFPILVKILDANAWLSVQVHPSDLLAMQRHGVPGKSELWYILEAAEDAMLVDGLTGIKNKQDLNACLQNNTLEKALSFRPVHRDDAYYIPAGRVHALGPGILLAEIQQTSDITYRLYDWDRIDEAGFTRELHADLALDAVDYSIRQSAKAPYTATPNKTAPLIENPHFSVNLLDFDLPVRKDYSELDSFVICLCTKGEVTLHHHTGRYPLRRGEAILLPAALEMVELHPAGSSAILEIYMEA